MMKKAEIVELCKRIATEYPGWEYTAGVFKNKVDAPFCTKLLDPLWSFNPGDALMQAVVGIGHKQALKVLNDVVYERKGGGRSYTISGLMLFNPPLSRRYPEFLDNRFYDLDSAENMLCRLFEVGFPLLEEYYDFSSEKSLLEHIPKNIEGVRGVEYCIVRAILGDFEFVQQYHADQIETVIPKVFYRIEKIMTHYGIEPLSGVKWHSSV